MEEVDKEISEMKLSLNARARVVAESYLTAVRTPEMTLRLSSSRFGSLVQCLRQLDNVWMELQAIAGLHEARQQCRLPQRRQESTRLAELV